MEAVVLVMSFHIFIQLYCLFSTSLHAVSPFEIRCTVTEDGIFHHCHQMLTLSLCVSAAMADHLHEPVVKVVKRRCV